MPDLDITPELVGRKVINPVRPEWGVGTVLRVQTTTAAGEARHLVSVQFATGHRVLHVPPARLAEPRVEAQRGGGWLENLAGTDLDARLRSLPAFVLEFLGTPRQRLLMLAPLFAPSGEPAELIKWARAQTGVADPLTHWTRDELLAAFGEFCARRDQRLRTAAAELRGANGPDAVARALAAIESPLRERIGAALAG